MHTDLYKSWLAAQIRCTFISVSHLKGIRIMEQDSITAFDTIYTNNHIQICKMAMMLLPPEKQRFAAVFIKYLEFNYTMKLCFSAPYHETGKSGSSPETLDLLSDFFPKILPFCTEKEAAFVKKIISLKSTFDSFEQMKPLLEMMSQMDSEATSSLDMLKGFLSPEQLNLFEMLKFNKFRDIKEKLPLNIHQ